MQFGRWVTTVEKHATSTLGGTLIQVLLATQLCLPNELRCASHSLTYLMNYGVPHTVVPT
jgi:hypothetical protein